MPINLHYGPDSPYQDSYGGYPAILPMLALRKPRAPWKVTVAKSSYNDKAVAEVLGALKLRIDMDTLFEKPLDGDIFRVRNGTAVVVIQRQVDFDVSNRPCHGDASPLGAVAPARPHR